MYIIDARPRLNAVANQLKGKGYERMEGYANAEITFVGIENIHKMRKSAKQLRKLCLSEMPLREKNSKLSTTKWLGKELVIH